MGSDNALKLVGPIESEKINKGEEKQWHYAIAFDVGSAVTSLPSEGAIGRRVIAPLLLVPAIYTPSPAFTYHGDTNGDGTFTIKRTASNRDVIQA